VTAAPERRSRSRSAESRWVACAAVAAGSTARDPESAAAAACPNDAARPPPHAAIRAATRAGRHRSPRRGSQDARGCHRRASPHRGARSGSRSTGGLVFVVQLQGACEVFAGALRPGARMLRDRQADHGAQALCDRHRRDLAREIARLAEASDAALSILAMQRRARRPRNPGRAARCPRARDGFAHSPIPGTQGDRADPARRAPNSARRPLGGEARREFGRP